MSIYTVHASDLDPGTASRPLHIVATPRGGRRKMPAKVERVLVSTKEDRVEILIRFYDKTRKRYGHQETIIRLKTDPVSVLHGSKDNW